MVGLFDLGGTGGGNNSGFESLLYLNGSPYQGVDSNHQEVFFSNLTGQPVDLHFQLWSGLEGGGVPRVQEHKFSRAALAWLDEPTDDLYFNARAILESVHILGSERAERTEMLRDLNRAFREIDWSYPGSDEFYASVGKAREFLSGAMQQWQKNESVTIHAVGHTHIEVAWLWRLKHTREKAARSFSTVLRLMEQFPEYTFLQTQPQLYDYLKTYYPEVYAAIKERVHEGRWEADGGMWLEADCNIPSGESFVRQLMMGTQFFETEFGTKCTYLWLPDVFGYSWALPQVLKKSGIETFVTTKISWNEYNRMPHDTFWWRGIDGSEILTHFITTPSPGKGYTYNGLISAESIEGTWTEYQDKSINQDLLLAYGYGDSGGGVNRDMLEKDARAEYQEVEQLVQAALDHVAQAPNSLNHTYTVANGSPWTRSDLIHIAADDSMDSGVWRSTTGDILAAQREEDGWIVQMRNLAPMSVSKFHFEPTGLVLSMQPKANEVDVFEWHENGVRTPYYHIQWNTSGQLLRIYDVTAQREVLSEGELGNVFQVFEDKPAQFDAWNVDLSYQEKMRVVTECKAITRVQSGPLRAVVRFQWRFANSTILQDLTLYSHTRRIDFCTRVDWHERQQLLKVAFPVAVRATEATYDIQFGNIRRPTHWNTSWDYAKFETVAHQWADLSEEGYGVSLLNDCKYGHDIKGHVMRLSLIKSAIHPDFAADQGLHEFTYALYPHQGSWVEAGTVQAAWYLNNQLRTERQPLHETGWSLFHLSSEHVMIDAVKKSERNERVVLRIHEFAGHRGTLRITSDFGILSWRECNLLEVPISDSHDESQIDCYIKPYEIKTFLIDMTSDGKN